MNDKPNPPQYSGDYKKCETCGVMGPQSERFQTFKGRRLKPGNPGYLVQVGPLNPIPGATTGVVRVGVEYPEQESAVTRARRVASGWHCIDPERCALNRIALAVEKMGKPLTWTGAETTHRYDASAPNVATEPDLGSTADKDNWIAKAAYEARIKNLSFGQNKFDLEAHARRELKLAGFYNADAPYGCLLPEAVLSLCAAHVGRGHSGYSAEWAVILFSKLQRHEALTPITSAQGDWVEVPEGGKGRLWQNRRDSTYFSTNGGKSFYTIRESDRPVAKVPKAKRKKR